MSERDFSEVSFSVQPKGWDVEEGVQKIVIEVWNPSILDYQRFVQPTTPSDTQPVSGTLTAVQQSASTATLTNVASSASSVTLLSANANRLGFTIWNDSTAILYVKFGTTAAATDCTVKMVADAYYEVPFKYTGIVDGIWASANGFARVTELTA